MKESKQSATDNTKPARAKTEEAGRQGILPVCTKHEQHHYEGELPALPGDDAFIEASVLFQQLSDSTRLKILWLLTHAEICVYDIAEMLGMSAPAVSHHLRSLRQLGLIHYRRKGKHVFYSLADNEDANHICRLLADSFDDIGSGQTSTYVPRK